MRAEGFFAWRRDREKLQLYLHDPNLIGLIISRLERYIINPQNPEKRSHRLTTRVKAWLDLCVMSVMRYVRVQILYPAVGVDFFCMLPSTSWKGWAARHGLYSFHHGLNQPFLFPVFQLPLGQAVIRVDPLTIGFSLLQLRDRFKGHHTSPSCGSYMRKITLWTKTVAEN